MIDETTLTIERGNTEYLADVFDITDKTFTISVTFPIEEFEYAATEVAGVEIDLNKEIGLLTSISTSESSVS